MAAVYITAVFYFEQERTRIDKRGGGDIKCNYSFLVSMEAATEKISRLGNGERAAVYTAAFFVSALRVFRIGYMLFLFCRIW